MIRLLSILLLILSPFAYAQTALTCAESAKTSLEKVFCEVKEKSPSAKLPSLNEFRKNGQKTQYFLLKRPAEKLGLTLPTLVKNPKQSVAKTIKDSPSIAETNPQSGLEELCKLGLKTIQCGSQAFDLLDNLPNNRLDKHALDTNIDIQLPEFVGDKTMGDEVIPYLKQAYQTYVEHMITIGLGASTMSFTKFYHTFMEVESEKISFSKRLSEMFTFLKKDKATIGVKSRYNDLLPSTLSDCSTITEKIIACDNVKQNWIYFLRQPI